MIIRNIELNNFKFHYNLDFKIDKQNCLIYGENGSGKSSIYWALYSLFKCYFRNSQFDFSKFQNKNNEESLSVKILLDDITLSIPHENYLLPNEINISNHKSIYFANQDLLNEITNEDDDFYNTILKYLKKYFTTLESFDKAYNLINETIDGTNVHEKNDEKELLDSQYKKYIENDLTPLVNDVLLNNLKENYQINLEFQSGILDTENLRFPNPRIILTIDNQSNFKLHFNEAKLKLTSIAIFFSLIKLEEDENNILKLLVLDDFLTSLDMANRKLIVQYILDDFKDYQKIILTHNIQFYNLIGKLIVDIQKEEETWDIKKLFLSSLSDENSSNIRTDNISFLDDAKERLENGDLQSSGNFLRKEFERLVHDFEILLELGKVEDMSHILDALRNSNIYYSNPHETISQLINSFEKILELPINETLKLSKIVEKIEKLKECKIDLNRKITFEDGTEEQQSLAVSLNKTNFYNSILLNPLSHDDIEIEAYRKECINIIELLTKLNNGLKYLKGKRF